MSKHDRTSSDGKNEKNRHQSSSRSPIPFPIHRALGKKQWDQSFFAHPSAVRYLTIHDVLPHCPELDLPAPGIVPYRDINNRLHIRDGRIKSVHIPKDELLCDLLANETVTIDNDPAFGDKGWLLTIFTIFGLPLKEVEGHLWERCEGTPNNNRIFQLRCPEGHRLPSGKYARLALLFLCTLAKQQIDGVEEFEPTSSPKVVLCDSVQHYGALLGLPTNSSRLAQKAFDQLLRLLNCEFRVVFHRDDPFIEWRSLFHTNDDVITKEAVLENGLFLHPSIVNSTFTPIDLRKFQYIAHYSRSANDLDLFFWACRESYTITQDHERDPDYDSHWIWMHQIAQQFDLGSRPTERSRTKERFLRCLGRLQLLRIVEATAEPYGKKVIVKAPWGPAIIPEEKKEEKSVYDEYPPQDGSKYFVSTQEMAQAVCSGIFSPDSDIQYALKNVIQSLGLRELARMSHLDRESLYAGIWGPPPSIEEASAVLSSLQGLCEWEASQEELRDL